METLNQIIDRETPAPFVSGSATSQAAATRIKGRSAKQRALVLDILIRAGEGGLTDEEGAVLTDLENDSYRPRRVELVRAGLVRAANETRKTRTGRSAQVWRVELVQ